MIVGVDLTGAVPYLNVRVYSKPVTQGSKKAFVTGKVIRTHPTRWVENPRAVVTESAGDDLKRFREAVRSTAADALPRPWTPVSGPTAAVLVFALPKPASAPVRRRTWPVKQRSGDVDKLQRAVFDALTDARAWEDDAGCTQVHVVKDYPGEGMDTPGVWIRLFDLVPLFEGSPPVPVVPEVPGTVPLPGM